jgi:hypothetical protein
VNHRLLILVVTCLFLIRFPKFLICIHFFYQENPEAPVDELSKEPVLGLTDATVDNAINPGKLKQNFDIVCAIVLLTSFSLKRRSKRSHSRNG